MKTGLLAAARRALLAGTLIFSAIAMFLAILAFALASPSQAQTNEIVEENLLDGSPKSEWDVHGAGDPNIQGFATDISVDQGQTVAFKVKTDTTDYRLDIYRMGYYGGAGARKVDTIQPSAQLLQNQPECLNDSSTGLIDCGNWGDSASWQVPANAVSGIYFAKLVREDGQNSGGSHILFIVRDDDGNSDFLMQTSDTTWQAYNQYDGNSLYTGQPAGRAYKVSYNRPITTRGTSIEDGVFNSEYPMVRWLERNGYDVSYFTGVDSDRLGAEIKEHKVFLSVGHDEYWSKTQRQNVEAARDEGVNLAFFSGNEVFWKTRWEDSHKTLVSYKETHAGAKIDPSPEWTGTWRDNRSFNPEGSQPENALTGTIFTVNCCTYNMEMPAADGKMRLWRDTTIATQAPNATATLSDGTLGYEWDEDLDNGSRPAGLVRMSSTTVDVPQRIQYNGSNYASGTATHSLTMYRDPNGTGPDALVFGAGTVQWSWGLDSDHDRGSAAADPRMQQATVNLFADMGTQPATLQSGLEQATASTDTSAPSSAIDSPQGGATVEEGKPVTITGTASDGETGGKVGGVEVSVDGGNTWHRAEGRESWRYTLGEASAVATLYSDANTATQNPAVTLRDVGTNGGQAAAFTYDLARSVVYTRQGNPAWAGDERDGQSGPIRSDDLFYGAKAGDVQPDWIDLSKVSIPQADEQQRLLANLIGQMNLDKKPLPRFWYFPGGEEAAVIMTGDDHASGGTAGQFDNFKAASPQGCSVADWECIRSTSYVYTGTPLSDAAAKAYQDEGFEVALHVNTNCNNFTPDSLEANFRDQLAEW